MKKLKPHQIEIAACIEWAAGQGYSYAETAAQAFCQEHGMTYCVDYQGLEIARESEAMGVE